MKNQKEKVALNKDTFESVLAMLNSPDEESVVLGLSIVEQTDKDNGMAYILMLKKKASIVPSAWIKDAPNTCTWMTNLGADYTQVVTFKRILEILTANKVGPEQIKFFLDEFGKHLLSQIRQQGYTFIDDLEINLKVKKYEQSGQLVKSE